jgi:hypothetical protein
MDTNHLHRVGAATIATGIGHNLIGAWLYRRQLAGVVHDGLVDAVENPRLHGAERSRRETALWFLMSGAAFMTLGAGLRRSSAGDGAIRPIATGMTAMGAVGAVAMPKSGFWLLLAEGVAARRLSRRPAITRYWSA